MNKGDEYTCERCGGTFECSRSDEEAVAEYEGKFNEAEKAEGKALVCEDCFKWIMTNSQGVPG